MLPVRVKAPIDGKAVVAAERASARRALRGETIDLFATIDYDRLGTLVWWEVREARRCGRVDSTLRRRRRGPWDVPGALDRRIEQRGNGEKGDSVAFGMMVMLLLGSGVALADVFTGTDGPDTYWGPVDDDSITGLGGGDFLVGDPTPYGPGGNEVMSGDDGDDRV